ncbi:cingulin-like isoform X2 [Salvelinus fontinalis]|uniref:cingulin-like isoform X2 n=1 Tax=Salvelinus fontinalis TaxID=8038 RepID=UPI0024866CF0|nr:cingulin-like isoform X2 [Salvelinus fontinalis]
MGSEDPQDQLDEAIKMAERLAEELNREKDPQAQLDEAIKEAKRLAEELNPEKDPQAQLEEAIKEAKRLAEELNREKDPQAQLDEAIKEAKRLAEELNREKDPQAQLDEAIKEAKRLAEKLNREKDPQAQLDEAINEAKRLAEELNPERENKKKKTNKPPGIRFRWIQRDVRGQIVPQTRKATTSTSFETSTSGLESTPVLNIDEEISILHREINILLADLEDPECSNPAVPGASHSWSVRKELSQDRWRESRPEIVDSLLAAEHASQKICQSCNVKRAILRCRDCLPKQLYCEDCDVSTHAKFPLHNRESMIEGFYTPLPPTTAISLHSDEKYALHEQDCFLPLDVPEVICGCLTSTIHVGPGKHHPRRNKWSLQCHSACAYLHNLS